MSGSLGGSAWAYCFHKLINPLSKHSLGTHSSTILELGDVMQSTFQANSVHSERRSEV